MRIIPMIPRSTMVQSSCPDLGYGNVSVTLECNGVRCHQTTQCKDMANYPDDRTRPSPKSVFGTEFLRVCCNIGAGSYLFSLSLVVCWVAFGTETTRYLIEAMIKDWVQTILILGGLAVLLFGGLVWGLIEWIS